MTTQPENDIAVLQAETLPAQVVPATLGNPNAMHVGDEAYVVGNPFGLYSSMSAGVISGFDRTFHPRGQRCRADGPDPDRCGREPRQLGRPAAQSLRPGVGIVDGIVNPTDENFFIGIGFAVPINVAGGAAGLPPY